MAGSLKGRLMVELVSPFLQAKLAEIRARLGTDSADYVAIAKQYLIDPLEMSAHGAERSRHYESELRSTFEGHTVFGVERLYRRTVLLEPTTACAANCRWCLRGQYPIRTLTRDEIALATRYFGSAGMRDDVNEILITGGDPLMSVPLLRHTLEMLRLHAPNITTVRIGTRVPFQDPSRINDAMLEMFAGFGSLRFEMGVNINHPVEFWPESIAAIRMLQKVGFRIYNQHPLLKGVNDQLDTLVRLYSLLREHDIEAHYLFHAIPMRGTGHHRTSLARALSLAVALSSCGEFSGRAKPRLAVLSDIGKIVLYHDSFLDRRLETNEVLIQSGYTVTDRQRWNPEWVMPPSVEVGDDGRMRTWYLDASDETDFASAGNDGSGMALEVTRGHRLL